tara:strand:- start:279 stop:1316 length:1038 start_codon:yes stop_codon:yes gene_type:complete
MPLQGINSVDNVLNNKEMKQQINKESAHMALMAAGLTPGVGIFADAADAALYLSEGEFGEAALSGVSMIPFVGQYAGSLRMLNKAKEAGEPTVKFFRGVTDVRYEKTFTKDSARMKGSIGLDKKVPEGNIVGGGDIISSKAGQYDGSLGSYAGDNLSSSTRQAQKDYFGVSNSTRELPAQALYTSTNPDIAVQYATKSMKNADIPLDMASRKPIILEFEVPVSWLKQNSRKVLSADKNLYDSFKIGGPGSKSAGMFQDMTIFDQGLPKGFLSKVHRYGIQKDSINFSQGSMKNLEFFSLKDIGLSGKLKNGVADLTSTWVDRANLIKKDAKAYDNIVKAITGVKF